MGAAVFAVSSLCSRAPRVEMAVVALGGDCSGRSSSSSSTRCGRRIALGHCRERRCPPPPPPPPSWRLGRGGSRAASKALEPWWRTSSSPAVLCSSAKKEGADPETAAQATTAKTTTTTAAGGADSPSGQTKDAKGGEKSAELEPSPALRLDTDALMASAIVGKYIGGKLPEEEPSSDGGGGPLQVRGRRRLGLVLHPTSLPGPHGMGDLGDGAIRLLDWMLAAGIRVWQVLPLGPPEEVGWSPYSGMSGFAGHPLMISLHELVKDKLLSDRDLPAPSSFPSASRADFSKVAKVKNPLLVSASKALIKGSSNADLSKEFETWRADESNASWVEDWALFVALGNQAGPDKMWWEWDSALSQRDTEALEAAKKEMKDDIDVACALQFLFERQWLHIRKEANARGIAILGDMPIYVGGHSADVWANQDLFELGDLAAGGTAAWVAGCPPDAFSSTGQLWGNPLYAWRRHQEDGFAWWQRRCGRYEQLFDIYRIDHFRAFAGYYAIPGDAETAIHGEWRVGPRLEFFKALENNGDCAGGDVIIAEDLGTITPDVFELRDAIGAPGMVVLQFAWGGGSDNVHLPHNYATNSVCYPGTHDNDTTVGWWNSVNQRDKDYLKRYFGEATIKEDGVAWTLIRAAMTSVADTCIVTLQDFLELGQDARMNLPGSQGDMNWTWKMTNSDEKKLGTITKRINELAKLTKRLD